MEDLFSAQADKNAPLSERMRANTLEEFVGQKHIVYENSLLFRAIKTNMLGSCIFYGPPGSGKTTLANIISKTTNSPYVKLNAVSSGVQDAKKVIEEARNNYRLYGKKTYLLLDECHRWNKAQSDSVLGAIEEGCIIFIGSTTENPYYSMTRAIVSRCRIFEFKPLSVSDIKNSLKNAITNKEKGYGSLNIEITEDALSHYAQFSGGDLRMAYNALELAVKTTPLNKEGKIVIDKTVAEQSIQKKALSLDEDLYYHLLSAFCKSLRGSDSTAALYYANRLIEAGIEPQVLARRTIAHASEDVGISAPQALLQACAALYALDNLGMPEGNLALTQAIIYVCESPKDNRVVKAMNMAQDDAKNHPDDNVPDYLKNHTEASKKYKYPHDYGGYVKQQYLPNSLKDRKYFVRKDNKKD
ncbi:MAG: replication-associated recombination protein A [Clostridia bacterium]|nr:replication-associated recombination protein A [Clostridia bacterium]